MKRTALLLALLVACADGTTVLGQQSAPPQPGRQGGPPQPGRQGDAPQGRQGGGRGQARDRAPATGTATISGRVVAADTGTPIRRAEVQATGGGDRPRGVLTDDNGRFELRELPAGRWTVRATKTGFISQQLGQRTPFTAADAVVLADRQQFSADFALTRGGAITGRVYDEFGDPIATARVSALRLASTPNGRRLTTAASSSPTDDTGAFRVYGLPAGDYYLAANVTTALGSNGSLVTAEGPVTYAPVYFPGTPDVSAAQRITLRAGEEQSGISMTLAPVRAVRVSGTVLGAAGTPIAARIALETPSVSDGGGPKNANTSANGTFIIPNVAPGTYLLTVTGRVTSQNTPPEVAAQSITIAGEDVTGLTITTAHGATISGVITAENGARVETAGIRVSAPPMRTGQAFTPRAQATAAGGFELSGLFGVHSLRFEPLPAGWAIKSVTVNGVDVTDTAMEFRGSDATSARVVLTNRLTEITGTIRSANPVPRGATVLVFPDDPSKWSSVSRYVRTARAGEAAQFTMRGLPPATRYLAIALDYLESGEQLDPEFLQRVKVRAAGFSLSDAEKKTLDLDLVER